MSEYTNRHGKRIQVNEEEVTSNVEPAPKKPKKAKPDKKSAAVAVQKPRKLMPKIPKKVYGYVLIAAIVFALIGLISADGVKREYERQTSTMKRTVIDRSKQATSNDTSPSATIKSLRSSLTANAQCTITGIDVISWYGPAKAAREECQQTADSYRKLQLALDDISMYSTYLEQVDRILNPALDTQASGEFAIIGDYKASWDTAVSELENVTPPEPLTQIHAKLIAKSKSVQAAWTTINDANNSRNAESFTASEKTLIDTYADLRSVSTDIHILLSSAQASITQYTRDLSS